MKNFQRKKKKKKSLKSILKKYIKNLNKGKKDIFLLENSGFGIEKIEIYDTEKNKRVIFHDIKEKREIIEIPLNLLKNGKVKFYLILNKIFKML